MGKEGVMLLTFCMLLIMFLSGGVLASDLNDCTDRCKADFSDEVNRSPCINECKELYDFEEKDDLTCLSCGDECLPYDVAVVSYCNPPTAGEPKCGVENGECAVVGFEDEEFYTNWDGTCGDFDCEDIKLADGGLTPDSTFYFIDEFFDRFESRLNIREEKIAEIKAMVQEGNIEAAHLALEKYKESAEELEQEIEPGDFEAAQKSSFAIKKTLREIEGDIPEEFRRDFIEDSFRSEEKLVTAAEIASKIKELCNVLSEIDPLEYSRVCTTKDDSPEWQKN